jgi:osmotically-inducible protein OsmY
MKAFPAIKVIGGALIVLASLNAYAQTDASAPAAATSAPTAKQTKQANRALQRKVRSTLARTKGLSMSNLTVRARGGDVTLQGSVPDAGQIPIATQAAQGVAGVNSVKSALTVRAEGQ